MSLGESSSAFQSFAGPEEGEAVWLVGDLITVKLPAESTDGVLSVVEKKTPPGGLEKFFLEAGDSAANGAAPPEGEPDVGRIVELGQEYGLEFPPPPTQ